MKIQTYKDMSIDMIRSTPYPAELVGLAMSITMHSDPTTDIKPLTSKSAKFLWNAEHTSLLEHVVYTFMIEGVSRSFLAQITRQRTASPTSGSQHYQDYSDYPCTVQPAARLNTRAAEVVKRALTNSVASYTNLLDLGISKEEARQVLPNAACVNYLWTIDALNLFKFLRTRLCNRNVLEMRIFANRVLSQVRVHFPEWFSMCGPQCHMGSCKQGFMRCKEAIWTPVE
jgi:thymidylate synthase (FAD)